MIRQIIKEIVNVHPKISKAIAISTTVLTLVFIVDVFKESPDERDENNIDQAMAIYNSGLQSYEEQSEYADQLIKTITDLQDSVNEKHYSLVKKNAEISDLKNNLRRYQALLSDQKANQKNTIAKLKSEHQAKLAEIAMQQKRATKAKQVTTHQSKPQPASTSNSVLDDVMAKVLNKTNHRDLPPVDKAAFNQAISNTQKMYDLKHNFSMKDDPLFKPVRFNEAKLNAERYSQRYTNEMNVLLSAMGANQPLR